MPPVLDGHNDVLLRAHEGDRTFLDGDEDAHLDLPRARAGDYAAGFFAAFVPTEAAPTDRWNPGDEAFPDEYHAGVEQEPAAREVLAMFERLQGWASRSDALRVVSDLADLEACLGRGDPATNGDDAAAGDVVGAVPHLEGAAPIAPDLSNLDALVDAGLRSVGLTWGRPNAFACGAPFVHDADPDVGPGLTEAGADLVAACEDRGLVVDCAHLNAAGFWDVLDLLQCPPVVSHTGAHEICPSARNLTDEQLRAVGDAGGVVGVTFAAGHLRPDGEGDPDTPMSALVDHVAHVAEVAGVDCVALGSDFDGATVIDPVAGADRLPCLLDALADAGFDETERRKVAGENWRRVLSEWW